MNSHSSYHLAADLRRLSLWGGLAVVLGVAVNAARRPALPWVYQTKAERLEAALPTGATLESSEFQRVSLEATRQAVSSGEVRIIDARTPLFFRSGHLPGAINLPREGFQAAWEKNRGVLEERKAGKLIVYCQGGSCVDSDLVAAALRALGFSDIAVFAGGWNEWRRAGLPEEKGS